MASVCQQCLEDNQGLYKFFEVGAEHPYHLDIFRNRLNIERSGHPDGMAHPPDEIYSAWSNATLTARGAPLLGYPLASELLDRYLRPIEGNPTHNIDWGRVGHAFEYIKPSYYSMTGQLQQDVQSYFASYPDTQRVVGQGYSVSVDRNTIGISGPDGEKIGSEWLAETPFERDFYRALNAIWLTIAFEAKKLDDGSIQFSSQNIFYDHYNFWSNSQETFNAKTSELDVFWSNPIAEDTLSQFTQYRNPENPTQQLADNFFIESRSPLKTVILPPQGFTIDDTLELKPSDISDEIKVRLKPIDSSLKMREKRQIIKELLEEQVWHKLVSGADAFSMYETALITKLNSSDNQPHIVDNANFIRKSELQPIRFAEAFYNIIYGLSFEQDGEFIPVTFQGQTNADDIAYWVNDLYIRVLPTNRFGEFTIPNIPGLLANAKKYWGQEEFDARIKALAIHMVENLRFSYDFGFEELLAELHNVSDGIIYDINNFLEYEYWYRPYFGELLPVTSSYLPSDDVSSGPQDNVAFYSPVVRKFSASSTENVDEEPEFSFGFVSPTDFVETNVADPSSQPATFSKDWLSQKGVEVDVSDIDLSALEYLKDKDEEGKDPTLFITGAGGDDEFRNAPPNLEDGTSYTAVIAGLDGNDVIDLSQQGNADGFPKLVVYGDAVEDPSDEASQIFLDYFEFDPNTSPGGDDTIKINALSAAEVYAGPGDDTVIVGGVGVELDGNGDIVGFVLPETVLDGGDGTDTLVLQLEDGVQLATTGRILPEALENLGTDFEQVQVQIGTSISLPAIDAETEIDYENSNSYDYTLDEVETGTYIRNNFGGFLRPDLLVPSDGYLGINGSPPYGDDLVAELISRRESIETEGDEALFEGPPVLSGSLVTKLDSLTVGETYSFKFSWQQIREVLSDPDFEYYGGGVTVRIGDKEVQISSDQTPAEHEWTEETIFFVAEAEAVFVEISASEQETFSDPTHRGGIVLIDVPGGNNAPALSLTPLVTSLTSSELTNAQEDIRVAQINIEDDGLGENALSLSSGGPFKIVSTEDGDFVVLQAGSSLGADTQLDFEVIVDDPEIGDGPEDSISGSVSIVSADDQAPGEGEPGDGEDSNDGSDDGDNTEASPSVPTATGDPMVPLFDEAGYLAANPDVAAAVEAGTVASGLAHFITFGLSEGRDPFELFDTAYYLEQYPDVAAAIEAGAIGSAFEHYIQFGQFENRNPSVLFHATDYLAANPDVAAAVENGTIASAFEHYVTFGATEGRDLNVA